MPNVIVGSNSSCNLDVLCDGVILNIHPAYDVRYFADDGSLIAHIKHGARVKGQER